MARGGVKIRIIVLMPDPFEMGPEFLGKIPLFAELQRLLRWDKGPVNWDLASQIATAEAASRQGAGANAIERSVADETFHLATMLLEDATALSVPATLELLGPVEFVQRLITEAREPFDAVAARASAGINEGTDLEAMLGSGQAPPGLGEALRSLGPMLLGAQTGGVIGAAAATSMGWVDLGLPMERKGPVLLPATVGRLVRSQELDEKSALLAACLLVAADHAIVTSFATLRTRFLSAMLDLVATLEHDLSAFGESLRRLDLSDPATLQQAMSGIELERSVASEQAAQRADAIGALHLAAVDRYVAAGAARAGLPASIGEVFRAQREREEASAMRAMLGLLPASSAAADSFVSTVVLEGGFELLNIALDDPMNAPSLQDLTAPSAWIERVRNAG